MPSPSGILTKTDREFLKEVPDYYDGENERQSRYERRRNIRKRMMRSLLDFPDIALYLEDEQRQKFFTRPEDVGSDDNELAAALGSLLQFVYLGCREGGPDFENLLKSAVRKAEEDYHHLHRNDIVDVDVEFDVEVTQRYHGVEEFARRIEKGERILADNVYRIPTLPDHEFDVDPEKVDTVRVVPSRAQRHPESEREIVATILSERLGVEPDVEMVGYVDFDPEELGDLDEDELPTGDADAGDAEQEPPDLSIPGVDDENDDEDGNE